MEFLIVPSVVTFSYPTVLRLLKILGLKRVTLRPVLEVGEERKSQEPEAGLERD